MKKAKRFLAIILVITLIFGNWGISSAATGHLEGCPNEGAPYDCCSKTFDISVKPGYQITDVLVNGVSQGNITDYTFSNMTGPQSLEVKTVALLRPNTPLIDAENMVPVKWDDDVNKWVTTTASDTEWYNYSSVAEEESNGTVEGNGSGKWANVMTVDGLSYYNNGSTGATTEVTSGVGVEAGKVIATQGSSYVWIPRYTYKIITGNQSDGNSWNADSPNDGDNKIKIKWSYRTTDDNSDDYLSHPAFKLGGYKGGDASLISNYNDYSGELEGIWVAKYEASMETDGEHTETTEANGNVATSSSIKAVSKPGVSSWRNITVSNMFSNALSINSSLNSHMMKNSEWGAVAYLTNAIGRIPYINNSSDYITGNAGGSQNAGEAPGTTNAWDSTGGVKATTTHNVYGIYDMSGGTFEYVASYYNENEESSEFLGEASSGTHASALYNNRNTKYVESYTTAWDDNRTGDAVREMSNGSVGYTSWNGN